MEITKKRLKEIIKEEMDVLALSGDLTRLTESEKELFHIILEKISDSELKDYGLKKIV